MGLSVSWICARGIDRAAALHALGLVETGEPADIWETPFSFAERPDGWLTITTTKSSWLLPQKVKALSSGGLAVGCYLEEHVMVSGACAYDRGAQQWWVMHDPNEGPANLTYGGALPPSFAGLKAAALEREAMERPGRMQVDHLFDVPVLLTADVCGYRADEYPPDSAFSALATLEVEKPAKRGFLNNIARLFGR